MNGVEINTRAYVRYKITSTLGLLVRGDPQKQRSSGITTTRLEVSWITSTRGLLLRGYTGVH